MEEALEATEEDKDSEAKVDTELEAEPTEEEITVISCQDNSQLKANNSNNKEDMEATEEDTALTPASETKAH